MKTQALAAGAALRVAMGAIAQGTINLTDGSLPPEMLGYVATDAAGNHYTGTFGIEVWGLNAAALPAGINVTPAPGSGTAGYDVMVANGFTLEATFANLTMNGGVFSAGAVTLPTIPGPEAVIALAAWNTPAPSWGAMLSSADAKTRAGVIAFVNPVSVFDATLPLAPAKLTGWIQDLVMTVVPEPGTFALAGLGGMALLLFRWRRWCGPRTARGVQDRRFVPTFSCRRRARRQQSDK